MKFAVVRQWADAPSEFQVIDYFPSIKTAREFIAKQKQNERYEYQIKCFEDSEEPAHCG